MMRNPEKVNPSKRHPESNLMEDVHPQCSSLKCQSTVSDGGLPYLNYLDLVIQGNCLIVLYSLYLNMVPQYMV